MLTCRALMTGIQSEGTTIMADRNDNTHIDETRASGGSKEGVVRWVLIIGTLLAIVLLTVIWMTGALTQGDQEEEITASGNIEAQANDDSIVGDGAGAGEGVAADQNQLDNGLEVIDNDPTTPAT